MKDWQDFGPCTQPRQNCAMLPPCSGSARSCLFSFLWIQRPPALHRPPPSLAPVLTLCTPAAFHARLANPAVPTGRGTPCPPSPGQLPEGAAGAKQMYLSRPGVPSPFWSSCRRHWPWVSRCCGERRCWIIPRRLGVSVLHRRQRNWAGSGPAGRAEVASISRRNWRERGKAVSEDEKEAGPIPLPLWGVIFR